MARHARLQSDGTFHVHCVECEQFITKAANEKAVLWSVSVPHECSLNAHRPDADSSRNVLSPVNN